MLSWQHSDGEVMLHSPCPPFLLLPLTALRVLIITLYIRFHACAHRLTMAADVGWCPSFPPPALGAATIVQSFHVDPPAKPLLSLSP